MKNIKKMILTSLLLPISMTVFSKPSYIPSDLEKFNKTGNCINCDLSEASLNSYDNANLSGALLVKAKLDYHHFYVSDFSHAQLMYVDMSNVQASGSNFNSANLTGAYLSYSNFSSSHFENANLSGAHLYGANLARATITTAQLSQAATIECAILPDGTRQPTKNGTAC